MSKLCSVQWDPAWCASPAFPWPSGFEWRSPRLWTRVGNRRTFISCLLMRCPVPQGFTHSSPVCLWKCSWGTRPVLYTHIMFSWTLHFLIQSEGSNNKMSFRSQLLIFLWSQNPEKEIYQRIACTGPGLMEGLVFYRDPKPHNLTTDCLIAVEEISYAYSNVLAFLICGLSPGALLVSLN